MLTSSQILGSRAHGGRRHGYQWEIPPHPTNQLSVSPARFRRLLLPHANAPPGSCLSVLRGRLRARAKPSSSKTIAFDVPGEAKSKRQSNERKYFFLVLPTSCNTDFVQRMAAASSCSCGSQAQQTGDSSCSCYSSQGKSTQQLIPSCSRLMRLPLAIDR